MDTRVCVRELRPFSDALEGILRARSCGGGVTLLIDSPGGLLVKMEAILNEIDRAPTRFRGVVTGQASSAAFWILQACDRRLACRAARFMFHFPSPGDAEPFSRAEASGRVPMVWHGRTTELLQKLARRSGQPFRWLRQCACEERVFSAEEALRFGFVDAVVEGVPE